LEEAVNRAAWDDRARRRLDHTRVASARELAAPMRALDPEGWLGGTLAGLRVLCLAAGGGLQSVLCAKAGAEVTVVDLSERMLELDRVEASRHQLRVTAVAASMTDLRVLGDGVFDVVLQPVSTCYVADLGRVFSEVARVLKPGGVYVSQHKQPSSLQGSALPGERGYWILEPCDDRRQPLPPCEAGVAHREAGTLEFLHRWEDLAGGLCRSGFVIEDVSEPRVGDLRSSPGTFAHRSAFLPPYVKFKARRKAGADPSGSGRIVQLG
jgi:SAM-dependent methyltransferase